MALKDATEKMLVGYNDVFADIMNVLLFDGEQVIKEDELVEGPTLSLFDGGKGRWQERDAVKFWEKGGVNLAIYGIENQSTIDADMPLRVMSYDGAFYRQMLENKRKGGKGKNGEGSAIYPVVTSVLYYGHRKPWERPLSLHQCFHVPEKLRPYVKDYGINVFNIAFLEDETVSKFKSDFKFAAKMFVEMRRKRGFVPSSEIINHVEALFSMLSAVTGDRRYLECYEPLRGERKVSMCEFLDSFINKGLVQGKQEGLLLGKQEGLLLGKQEGLLLGQKNMAEIVLYLMRDNRLDDLRRAAEDEKYLEQVRAEMEGSAH